MANEKLYELTSSGDYDLVVVDTPPTRNALDFLDAPAQLARMLDHRVYRVLTAPAGGYPPGGRRRSERGPRRPPAWWVAAVIDDAIAFFAAFEGMEQGFRERSANVRTLLDSPATAFVLVASPRPETVTEAEEFARRLREQDIDVRALIVNRVHPRFAGAVERRR